MQSSNTLKQHTLNNSPESQDIIIITWENGRAIHADICRAPEQARHTAFYRMAENTSDVEVVTYAILHHDKPNDHQFIAQQWFEIEIS